MQWCLHNTGHNAGSGTKREDFSNRTRKELVWNLGCTLLQDEGLEALHKITQLVSGKGASGGERGGAANWSGFYWPGEQNQHGVALALLTPSILSSILYHSAYSPVLQVPKFIFAKKNFTSKDINQKELHPNLLRPLKMWDVKSRTFGGESVLVTWCPTNSSAPLHHALLRWEQWVLTPKSQHLPHCTLAGWVLSYSSVLSFQDYDVEMETCHCDVRCWLSRLTGPGIASTSPMPQPYS